MGKLRFLYVCPDGELHEATAWLVLGRPFLKRDRVLISREKMLEIAKYISEPPAEGPK